MRQLRANANVRRGRGLAVLPAAIAWTALLLASTAVAGSQIDDKDITNAIETDLLLDDAVASHLIDVNTNEGIVTVSGTVNTALGARRAVEIAEAIKGVRAVVDQLKVRPADRTDKEIRNEVLSALATDPAADSYELDVQVDDGTVTLDGTVESWQEKQLAATVARGVRGVQDVRNQIEVDYETERNDREIKADVKRRLETDVQVDAALIDVAVDDGKVKLAGTAGSAAEKRRATNDAWVAGTQSVDNTGLDVEWWARDRMRRKREYPLKTDQEIEDAVEDALLYDPRVLSFAPDVSVDNGVVSLTGTVDDLAAKRAAEGTAQNVVGVWRVENRLRVRPDTLLTDAKIEDRVRDALEQDPYVQRREISVDVLNGKAYLAGDVDSQFEKDWAEDVASGVDGVLEVENNLVVLEEWVRKSDREIRDDIEDQLFWNPYVDSDNVTVTVDGGVATLNGTVDTWFEQRKAVESAWEGGARDVHENLRVREYSPGD